jgi:hypothetical protein
VLHFNVWLLPVRIRWRLLWEIHIEGIGVTQSRRRYRDAVRIAEDYIEMSGVLTKFHIVLIPLRKGDKL